jgi:hypothetical protein
MPRKEPRNYAKEYNEYHGKPAQVENRNQRNKAVRKLGREGKASKDGKEVDHKKGSSKGSKLSNGNGNLRVVSKATNRKKQ